MAKKEKTAITIDDKDYFYEDLAKEQQIIVNHISDLQRKINSSEFNLQQLIFGKDAFVNALKKALEDAVENENASPELSARVKILLARKKNLKRKKLNPRSVSRDNENTTSKRI